MDVCLLYLTETEQGVTLWQGKYILCIPPWDGGWIWMLGIKAVLLKWFKMWFLTKEKEKKLERGSFMGTHE